MMQKLRITLGVIVCLILLSFIIGNSETVAVDFWPSKYGVTAPLWVVIVGSAALGILAFYFFKAFQKSKKPE
jgi:uncharacterized integral membrane protein